MKIYKKLWLIDTIFAAHCMRDGPEGSGSVGRTLQKLVVEKDE